MVSEPFPYFDSKIISLASITGVTVNNVNPKFEVSGQTDNWNKEMYSE